MSVTQKELHILAYFEDLMDQLEQNASTTQNLKLALKRAGTVVGGTLAGTLVLGPIGLVAGAAIAGKAAYDMERPNHDLVSFLREMDGPHKAQLVGLVEEQIGSPDVEALKVYIKKHREKLLNLIKNFMSDEFGYEESKGLPTSKDGYEKVEDE